MESSKKGAREEVCVMSDEPEGDKWGDVNEPEEY
jgi:hypothetical protein